MNKFKKDLRRIKVKRQKELFEDYLKAYKIHLENQYYTRTTIKTYSICINFLGKTMRKFKVAIKDLNEEKAVDLINKVKLDSPKRTSFIYIVKHFVKYLTSLGVIKPTLPSSSDACWLLKHEYEVHLRHERGLSESTIRACVYIADHFLQFRLKDGKYNLSQLEQKDVINFLQYLTANKKPLRSKTFSTRLRSFFQFLFKSKKTTVNLALSVPCIAQKYAARLPRYLLPDQVEVLIGTIKKDTPIGRRNYAMILLLARLGLRPTEVIAMQIDDIDWRAGEIMIRGKGKLYDRLPIPKDVGEALVDYIRHDRLTASRFLFVNNHAPRNPFKDATILNSILRNAFTQTKLKPPTKYVGSHILRHSLATNMIRKGSSIVEIGSLLRHRSRQTTMIYAKLDLDALRSIAIPWPTEGGTI